MILNTLSGGGAGYESAIVRLAGGAIKPENVGTLLSVTGPGRLYFCSHYLAGSSSKPISELKVTIDGAVIYHIRVDATGQSSTASIYGGIVNPKFLLPYDSTAGNYKHLGPCNTSTVRNSTAATLYEIGSGLQRLTKTAQPTILVDG